MGNAQERAIVKTILVLHALLPHSRGTTFKHVYAFPRHGPGNLYVFHHLKAPVTDALKRIPFDGIIINYCFLGHRTERVIDTFKDIYSFVARSPATKIAICQDDYTSNVALDRWLDELGIDVVYSPITRDLDALYPIMSKKPGVEFREGLTGYVDDDMLAGIDEISLPLFERTIDIGTRVRAIPPHLGRHGQKKAIVTQRFCEAAIAEGFTADWSTDPSSVLLGKDWMRFLGSCRATIGSRGGASAADPDGSTKARCLAYLKEHPEAPYDEVKAACFPDTVDTYRFDAISPRLFEAAATRTCQVLIRDDYLGLEPYEDYIPLEEDFSNLAEVFELLRNDDAVVRMTESAHRKLIASDRFGYGNFVREVLDAIPERESADQETFELISQHFKALRPFIALDEALGSLTALTAKRSLVRHLRNEPDMDRPQPYRSAIASLIECGSFPNYPERAIRYQMLCNWAGEFEKDLRAVLTAVPDVTQRSKALEAWGFCECLFDPHSSMPQD
jgi:hypothetical protein